MRWQLTVRYNTSGLLLDVDEQGVAPIVAIVGPNGSGKTSLLQTICGAVQPESGVLSVDNRVFFDASQGVTLTRQDRGVGYVPQGSALFPHLTVIENLLLPWRGTREEGLVVALDYLKELGCAELFHAYPMTLSGGETQRVAMIRALMRQPRVLVLDEPMAAQDVLARKPLRDFFIHHRCRLDIPLFFVTHDARDVVASNAYVLVLNGGRVVERGPVNEVLERTITEFSKQFFERMKG